MDDEFLGRYLLSLNPSDVQHAQEAALADRIATYFTQNQRLTYLGVAGIGRHGGAILFRERDENDRPFRKIIVKFSLTVTADADLRNEARWLEILRGAEHIVRLIPLTETELNITGAGRRPTIALEYLTNGDLATLRRRLARIVPFTPNRLLWRVFLCLVRQVLAMLFPPRAGPDDPDAREVLWENAEPFTLTQNSPHGGNVVIGDLAPGDIEHGLTPIFKLIDFGRGRTESKFEVAIKKNLWGAGHLLQWLAVPTLPTEAFSESPVITVNWIGSSGEEIDVETQANATFLQTQAIDIRLRQLVSQCMATHFEQLPQMYPLLQECEHTVANKGPLEFYNQHLDAIARERETDAGIERLLNNVLLNADVPDDPGEINRPSVVNQTGTTLLGLYSSLVPKRRGQQDTLYQGYTEAINRMRSVRPGVRKKTLFEKFTEAMAIRRRRKTRRSDVD